MTVAVDYAYDGNDALSTLSYSTGLTQTYTPDAWNAQQRHCRLQT